MQRQLQPMEDIWSNLRKEHSTVWEQSSQFTSGCIQEIRLLVHITTRLTSLICVYSIARSTNSLMDSWRYYRPSRPISTCWRHRRIGHQIMRLGRSMQSVSGMWWPSMVATSRMKLQWRRSSSSKTSWRGGKTPSLSMAWDIHTKDTTAHARRWIKASNKATQQMINQAHSESWDEYTISKKRVSLWHDYSLVNNQISKTFLKHG